MSSIDEHIRRAMEEGKFDNLPGKGKPLKLDDDSLEDPEWRVAYRMLRNSGFTLPWIETRQEIETELESARQALRRAWEWRQSGQARKRPAGEVQAEWDRAVENFRSQVAAINKKIFNYNLETPSSQFQRGQVDAARELAALTV